MTRVALLLMVSLTLSPACGSSSDGDTSGSSGSTATTWADHAAEIPVVKRAGTASESCAAGFVDAGFEAGQHDGYEAAGQMRGFYLALPDAEAFPGPRPTMVLFNGTGGTGLKAYNSYGGAAMVEAGFIVLAPDSNANGVVWPSWFSMIPPGNTDDNNPDAIYFESLLDCASAHLEIDENRIYIAGHSAGGIMTNYMLQHYPHVFAGGVAASSIFDLTAPLTDTPMQPMAVIVMWGGDNDIYSGDSETEGVAVPEIDFREQAAIASSFYEGLDGGHQIHCKGADLGHAWASGADTMIREFLLAHPKGLAQNPGWTLESAPAVTEATCSEEVYEYAPSVVVECGEATIEGCQPMCQLFGDCLISNATVAPVLGPALEIIGFDGADCAGCLSTCETTVGEDGDPAMACMQAAAQSATCGEGITGALPAITAINTCCVDQPDSALCASVCGAVAQVSVAISFIEAGCATWLPATCESGADCADTEYCAFDDGYCGWNGGVGTCQARPEGCVEGGPGACGCAAGAIGTNGCEIQANNGVDTNALGGCAPNNVEETICGDTTCDSMMEYCHIDLSAETNPTAGTCVANACIDPGPPTCACVPEDEQAHCHDDTGYPMVVIPEG